VSEGEKGEREGKGGSKRLAKGCKGRREGTRTLCDRSGADESEEDVGREKGGEEEAHLEVEDSERVFCSRKTTEEVEGRVSSRRRRRRRRRDSVRTRSDTS
jgi:hypothetical protein